MYAAFLRQCLNLLQHGASEIAGDYPRDTRREGERCVAGATAGVQCQRIGIGHDGIDHQIEVLARRMQPALAIVGGDIAKSLLNVGLNIASRFVSICFSAH